MGGPQASTSSLCASDVLEMLQQEDEIKDGIPSHVSPDLNAPPRLSLDEVRERMSGNICRCGAYSNIVEAMLDVAGESA